MLRTKTLACTLVLLLLAAAPALADGVKWLSLQEARQQQAAQYRPLFLYFHLPYCFRCKEMKEWVFSEPAVAARLNGSFWAVKLDLDQNPQASKEFKVQDVPTFLFLGKDGAVRERKYGVIRKEAFMELLRRMGNR